jgi:hypothetical protein
LETNTLVIIIVAILAAFFIAAYQYIYQNKKEGTLKYVLSFLRFISLLSLFILIINPSFKKNSIEKIKPNLVVAVDNSTSIKYNLLDSKIKNLVKQFKTSAALNNKYSIQYFGFGNSLFKLDTLSFLENQTDLALPIKQVKELFGSNISPLVLITDGNQTVGDNVEFINFKNPVFPFIVGDTTLLEDISIERLNVNEFTQINNKFPVEIFVNYTGNKPVSKRLTIYHKRKKVFSKVLAFSKEESVNVESLYLTTKTKGTSYYTAVIEELDNEQNTVNNTKNFSIKVVEDKLNVLILSSITHPDLGMLKKSIEQNKQRSVKVYHISDFKGTISDYQLVILYQPSKYFKDILSEINQKKINYFIISGLQTDWQFLNTLALGFSKEFTNQTENYIPSFNINYANYLTKDIGFSNFSPLADSFGEVSFSYPINCLLYKKIGTIQTDKPLLATMENNKQRIAILLGENSWRWRMNSFISNTTFENFDKFIANLIQYLASNKENMRLKGSVKPIYYANEKIQILASYLDDNYNLNTKAKLFLTISNKEQNFTKRLPFTLKNNRFIIELSDIPSGEYNYTIHVEKEKLKLSGSFKILSFEVEKQFTNSNDTSLKKLASATGGAIYYNMDEQKLLNNLLADERFKTILHSKIIKIPLIEWKWLLAIILFFHSLEWFLRKYYGKI